MSNKRYLRKVFDEMGESGLVPSLLTCNVLLGGWELMCKLWEMISDEEDLSLRNAAFALVIMCVELWKKCLKEERV